MAALLKIEDERERRKELEGYGHAFRSQCDTEVILRGYRQWGIDQLTARLRGMFAFAVWDNRERKLALVRDRLGVKPLVFAAAGDRIAFASTVRALRAADLAGEIDPQAVLEFLEFGFVTEARTIFKEARKVAPATIVEWKAGRLEERCYWKLPEANGSSRIGFPEAVEETEQLLLEASDLCRRLGRVGRLVLLHKAMTTSARRFVEGGILRVLAHDARIWLLDLLGLATEQYGPAYQEDNRRRGRAAPEAALPGIRADPSA